MSKSHFGSSQDCHTIGNMFFFFFSFLNLEGIAEHRGRVVVFLKIKSISLYCCTSTFLETQITYFEFISHLKTSDSFLDLIQASSHLDIDLILLWLFSTRCSPCNESAPLTLPECSPTVTVLWLQHPAMPCLELLHLTFYAFLSLFFLPYQGQLQRLPRLGQPFLSSGLSLPLPFHFFFGLPLTLALLSPLWYKHV